MTVKTLNHQPNLWLMTGLLTMVLAACTAPTDDPKPGTDPNGIAEEEQRSAGPKSITAEELNERIQSSQAPLILDVRTEREYELGRIPGALNIPHDELSSRLREIEVAKTEEIVVYCFNGNRSKIAETTLDNYGYVNLRDLDGHIKYWRRDGFPIEKP
jgi:rhodanese-related sulfurtransferase